MGLERLPRRAASEQRAELIFAVGRVGEPARLSGLEGRDRHAVLEQHAVAVERRDPGLRREDADQVERIDRAQHQELVERRLLANRAQATDRVRGGELLAAEAGDESPAADLAARLEAAVDADQLAPRRKIVFSFQ